MLARTPPNYFRPGHPKMLPPGDEINPPSVEWIDINAVDATDPVHFTHHQRKVPDDQFDYSQDSDERGDGPLY